MIKNTSPAQYRQKLVAEMRIQQSAFDAQLTPHWTNILEEKLHEDIDNDSSLAEPLKQHEHFEALEIILKEMVIGPVVQLAEINLGAAYIIVEEISRFEELHNNYLNLFDQYLSRLKLPEDESTSQLPSSFARIATIFTYQFSLQDFFPNKYSIELIDPDKQIKLRENIALFIQKISARMVESIKDYALSEGKNLTVLKEAFLAEQAKKDVTRQWQMESLQRSQIERDALYARTYLKDEIALIYREIQNAIDEKSSRDLIRWLNKGISVLTYNIPAFYFLSLDFIDEIKARDMPSMLKEQLQRFLTHYQNAALAGQLKRWNIYLEWSGICNLSKESKDYIQKNYYKFDADCLKHWSIAMINNIHLIYKLKVLNLNILPQTIFIREYSNEKLEQILNSLITYLENPSQNSKLDKNIVAQPHLIYPLIQAEIYNINESIFLMGNRKNFGDLNKVKLDELNNKLKHGIKIFREYFSLFYYIDLHAIEDFQLKPLNKELKIYLSLYGDARLLRELKKVNFHVEWLTLRGLKPEAKDFLKTQVHRLQENELRYWTSAMLNHIHHLYSLKKEWSAQSSVTLDLLTLFKDYSQEQLDTLFTFLFSQPVNIRQEYIDILRKKWPYFNNHSPNFKDFLGRCPLIHSLLIKKAQPDLINFILKLPEPYFIFVQQQNSSSLNNFLFYLEDEIQKALFSISPSEELFQIIQEALKAKGEMREKYKLAFSLPYLVLRTNIRHQIEWKFIFNYDLKIVKDVFLKLKSEPAQDEKKLVMVLTEKGHQCHNNHYCDFVTQLSLPPTMLPFLQDLLVLIKKPLPEKTLRLFCSAEAEQLYKQGFFDLSYFRACEHEEIDKIARFLPRIVKQNIPSPWHEKFSSLLKSDNLSANLNAKESKIIFYQNRSSRAERETKNCDSQRWSPG